MIDSGPGTGGEIHSTSTPLPPLYYDPLSTERFKWDGRFFVDPAAAPILDAFVRRFPGSLDTLCCSLEFVYAPLLQHLALYYSKFDTTALVDYKYEELSNFKAVLLSLQALGAKLSVLLARVDSVMSIHPALAILPVYRKHVANLSDLSSSRVQLTSEITVTKLYLAQLEQKLGDLDTQIKNEEREKSELEAAVAGIAPTGIDSLEIDPSLPLGQGL